MTVGAGWHTDFERGLESFLDPSPNKLRLAGVGISRDREADFVGRDRVLLGFQLRFFRPILANLRQNRLAWPPVSHLHAVLPGAQLIVH